MQNSIHLIISTTMIEGMQRFLLSKTKNQVFDNWFLNEQSAPQQGN